MFFLIPYFCVHACKGGDAYSNKEHAFPNNETHYFDHDTKTSFLREREREIYSYNSLFFNKHHAFPNMGIHCFGHDTNRFLTCYPILGCKTLLSLYSETKHAW